MLKKSVSIVLTALFVFSFIAVATVSAQDKMGGILEAINLETGEVVVKDDAGETKSLMVDPKAVDLKMFKPGDPVSVESDAEGKITSITKAE
jgi:hypothetical protein